MLTWQDCLGLVDLTEEEIAAIAEHEHLTQLGAMALGQYLVEHEGSPAIRRMILDDIARAQEVGDLKHALVLKLALRHFVQTHRDAVAENGSSA